MVEGHVGETPWKFESSLRHQQPLGHHPLGLLFVPGWYASVPLRLLWWAADLRGRVASGAPAGMIHADPFLSGASAGVPLLRSRPRLLDGIRDGPPPPRAPGSLRPMTSRSHRSGHDAVSSVAVELRNPCDPHHPVGRHIPEVTPHAAGNDQARLGQLAPGDQRGWM